MKRSTLRTIIFIALGSVAVACAGSDAGETALITSSSTSAAQATATTSGGSSTSTVTSTTIETPTTAPETTTSTVEVSTTTTDASTTTLQPTTTIATTTTLKTTTTQAQVVKTVSMGSKDGAFFYAPGAVSIPVGGKVVWVNNDTEDHDVQSGVPATCDGIFCSSTIAPGGSYSFTFTSAGTFPYFCLLHPGLMMGTISVTEP